jgi:hypothetical protein
MTIRFALALLVPMRAHFGPKHLIIVWHGHVQRAQTVQKGKQNNCQIGGTLQIHSISSSFPSIWEVPINEFHSLGGFQRSAMLRGVIEANTTSEAILLLLKKHFQRSYSTNRAPVVLTLNADFLQIGGGQGLEALIG